MKCGLCGFDMRRYEILEPDFVHKLHLMYHTKLKNLEEEIQCMAIDNLTERQNAEWERAEKIGIIPSNAKYLADYHQYELDRISGKKVSRGPFIKPIF